jgi:alpha-L-rhamnosidase
MRSIIAFLLGMSLFVQSCTAGLKPERLTCENLKDPAIIDVPAPRLSWINTDRLHTRGQKQTAWEIIVSSTREGLKNGRADLWSSGKVNSSQSFNIQYKGKRLESRQDCWWQVRVWDMKDEVSQWSEPASWSMGLIDENEWKAQWIGAPWQGEEPIPDRERPLTASRARQGQTPTDISTLNAPPPAPMLRKTFNVSKKIESARAYVTGLGYFEFYVNGRKAGNDVLVPNQTNYGKRPGLMNNPIPLEDNFREYKVFYLAYDIKDMIRKGRKCNWCHFRQWLL